jgi:phosphoglycolate phosphatase-like HAD superfamily hydrolase
MTEALTVPTVFGGKQIRVIEKGGETWMPCKDLGIALGLDRSTLYHHVQRNRDFFGDSAIDGDILSPDEGDLWVNEQGLYLLLARISTGRVNPDIRGAIIRFRQDIPKFLQQYRKREIAPVPAAPDICAELQEARELAVICGKSPESFQAVILRKHGKTELADALTPSLVHGESGWYTPTRLIETFMRHDPTLTPKRLNQYLSNTRENGVWAPFQYRDENHIWRLAPRGIPHGKEKEYTVPDTGHKEIRILWKESVLAAAGLKRPELQEA